MKQSLDMRQGQSLVMTPQLQQAIKLLQLSNQELTEFVEAEIERNPLLNKAEETDGGNNETDSSSKNEQLSLDDSSGLGEAREQLDAPGEDVYEPGTGSDAAMPAGNSGPSAKADWSGVGGNGSGEDFDYTANLSSEVSLHEHLHTQLNLAGLSAADRLIAARLIDETDDSGYMRGDLEDIAEALGADVANIEAVLDVCQGFDPTGVMARSIPECLGLQLKERGRYDPAMEAMVENLQMVAKHDLKGLAEVCGVGKEDLLDMMSELRQLSPKPGSGFSSDASVAVTPDVFVRELPNGMFAVELNSDNLPRVLMDKAYYAEVTALPMRDKEKEFISECAASATWLIKSLDQRARTILKVASEIVRQQDAFFAHGVAHLRPLNLKQVADAIEMHESTVSRVTTNKYMSTPRGLFELKYFFSAAIPATGGGEAHSAEAVRYRIKQLIDGEDADDVLSDDQIVEILTGYGVEIARRTVAKYRESLNIPSSVQRRRINRAS
ncbi:RNA polymerase factor sigma-54 [Hyphomonas pacifica]|uniref:RNA polymerase sigma-54 factor n=1 Tax=Hyphomonas pacifica TaxID=1280941 RepID=A0A062U838_9PROT|nr:RNA polymerase factor sigma-54 [Hyphomonas pacifica]KCZ52310.1 RNA polymerase sigma54 factor [Hyphomonas pacifica]RAN34796.1 RNA polymerase sigma54 factor [Hyphomonas pacifica]